jgi:hypothetical protein
MHYFFEVSVPAGTTEAAPYEKVLQVTRGTISRVEITIPSGHYGLAHLQVLYHEFQLYPLSRGEDYHGDDNTIAWDEAQEIDAPPYQLKARGWNTDDTYAHAFLVAVTMQRREEDTGKIQATTLEALQVLTGSQVDLGE